MKKRLVALKHLPPEVVSQPLGNTARAHAQKTRRMTTALLFLCVLCVMTLFVYEHSAITGDALAATTANVTASPPVNCSVPLVPGLNMISLNCISNFQLREEVMNTTDVTLIDAMYEYRPNVADSWRVYAPNLPSYVVSDLTRLSRLKGYLVYIDSDQNLSTSIDYQGALAVTSSMPAYAGNNLLGYPRRVSQALPGVLTTIEDTYWRVRTYNTTNGWLEFNVTHGNAGGLTNLTSLEGYWVTMNATDTWVVNSS